MSNVFVVTDVDLGWDNVVAVFTTKELAIKYCAARDGMSPEEWKNFQHSTNIIHEEQLDPEIEIDEDDN